MGLFKSLFRKKENKNTNGHEKSKNTTHVPRAEELDIWKTPLEPKKELSESAFAPKNSEAKASKKQPEKDTKASVKSKNATSKKETSPIPSAITNTATAVIDSETENADQISTDTSSKKVKVRGYGGAFEIKKSKDGRFVFNLFAANKVIVATSQIYSSSQSAVTGINSVIANAERAAIEDQTLKTFTPQSFPKWEIYIDKGGQFRFRLLASNGSCVCHSQGYTQKSTCKKGIESVIRTVKNAKIDKAYLKK